MSWYVLLNDSQLRESTACRAPFATQLVRSDFTCGPPLLLLPLISLRPQGLRAVPLPAGCTVSLQDGGPDEVRGSAGRSPST